MRNHSTPDILRDDANSTSHVAFRHERHPPDGNPALSVALLASVLHDLRGPLSVIIGASEVLRHSHARMDEGERQAFFATIRSEGERLDGYLQNLLHMARLAPGGEPDLVLMRDWIGIDEIVGSAVSRARRHAGETRIDVACPQGLPLLHVHGALLEQAIFNIVHNATKFSPNGATVRVRVSCAGDSATRVDIEDQGPGVAPEDRERVFATFHSNDPVGGTGLGLTISRAIVRAHGGDVAVGPATDGGDGACFRITLPATEGASESAR